MAQQTDGNEKQNSKKPASGAAAGKNVVPPPASGAAAGQKVTPPTPKFIHVRASMPTYRKAANGLRLAKRVQSTKST